MSGRCSHSSAVCHTAPHPPLLVHNAISQVPVMAQAVKVREKGVCSGVGSQRAQGSERGEWGNAVVVGTRRRR